VAVRPQGPPPDGADTGQSDSRTILIAQRIRTLEGAKWNGFFLGGAADSDVTGGMSVESALEHGAGDIGVIAITAEVTEPEVPQAWRDDLTNELGRLLITEVAVTAGDPLFDGPWSFGVGGQQLRAIIRFDKQAIQFPQARQHGGGRMPQITDDPKP
jgi:hypothetical protein